MFRENEIALIRQTVQDVLKRTLPENIAVTQGPGLTVTKKDGLFAVTAENKTALSRAFMRLLMENEKNAGDFTLHEERHFESCGSFLDFSRNGVMTVEACERFIANCAVLGLDTVVLYTEDTIEVPEYPYMGYLRGRLSLDEIRRIDDYADALGVEIVPCLQTLAHLGNFLQWRDNQHLRDQPTVLMIDDEGTYDFIEAEIRAARSAVRSRRLHIGMDEAHGVGLGRYYAQHGPTDRFELLMRHLNRCVDIAKKYDFHPIMWSDMFFRLGSKTDEYYDRDAMIPESVIAQMPDVDLCYWDYYNQDESMIEHMLCAHEKLSPRTAYAGGVWIWSGFLPHVQLTTDTMEIGLKHCMRHKTKTVLATTWGDDGNETDPFLALNQMAIFSEFNWRGEDCSHDVIAETGAFLTGIPDRAYEAFGLAYPDRTYYGNSRDIRWAKALIWTDLLYPLGPERKHLDYIIAQFEKAKDILKDYEDVPECAYAEKVFGAALGKARMIKALRPLYEAGDKAGVRELAEKETPALYKAYEELRDAHKARWESIYKRNGWEVLCLRYGGVMARMTDVQNALLRWCDGTLDTICELDETPLSPVRKYNMQFYQVYVSPVFNL